jgi:hypothetical protein
MSLPHRSVATIDSPEFINLQPLDINPLMSKCEIKVFYIGENRNHSFISKEVAMDMAKTLRGAPIVGYYKESKEDFADHGSRITMDDEGIHFDVMTKPYGFVAPDAEVWFQKFTDTDDFGNEIEREYLVTTGYLWTGQFQEVQSVLDEGKPQSMEIDEGTLDGHWAENYKNGMEFFIINDAIVSKLCILGNDVEPCFEGAAITAASDATPTRYTLDDDFKKSLFSMMKELEFALKGDNTVEQLENQVVETVEEVVDVEPAAEFTEETVEVENQVVTEDASNSTEFAQKEDDEQSEEDGEAESDGEDEEDENKKPVNNSLHTDEEYDELHAQFTALQEQYETAKAQLNELIEFKNNVEDKQKDALIAQFFMLSDEDKQDVIENKRQYSLEDIESKLAVICYRKKINFNLDASSETSEEEVVTTFSLNDVGDSTPDWVKSVMDHQNKN